MNNRILLVLAVVASLGIFFGYIGPTWSGDIASLRASIASANDALAAAASFDARVKQLAAAKEGLSTENIEKLERMLPDSIDTIGVIIDLNAQLVNSGLTVDSIVVGDVATTTDSGGRPASPRREATILINAAGSYTAVKDFLSVIEKSQHVFDVKDIKITGSDTNVYTYTIELLTYWLG